MTTRKLVLLRHAEPEADAGSDVDRALTAEGREDARAAGAWVRGRRRQPYGHALVSTARRARETYNLMLQGGAAAEDMWTDQRLYGAGPEEYLSILADVPSHVQRLLVVAHLPGVALAALHLADETTSDPQAWADVNDKVRTCGFVVLETETPWNELHEGCARLVLTHTARAGDPEDSVIHD